MQTLQVSRGSGEYQRNLTPLKKTHPAEKPAGRPGRSAAEAENERLRKENEKLATELARTKAALEVVGKAHALLELLSGSADSDTKRQR